MMLRGSMTALVTPFKNDEVDEKRLRDLIEFQIENGTDAIVPCGTTGEAATLSMEEHRKVVEIVVDAVNGRIPVIAGTGSNNTKEAIELTEHARESGADAALLIAPYYNKPTQEGLYQHFKLIADTVDIPIVLYNVPGRTSVNILPDTVKKLSEIRNIIGIKEASGSLTQVSEIIASCESDFLVLSGEDSLTLPILAVGGAGMISVIANIMPAEVAELYDSFAKGDLETAREIYLRILPMARALMKLGTNPIPVKTALHLMGMISAELRLPLAPMSDPSELRRVMKNYKLIKQIEIK